MERKSRKIKKIKKIKNMTIADVLKLPLFFENAEKEISNIWKKRESARTLLNGDERLSSHPIDDLKKDGFLETGEFIVTYANILEKKETRLSRVKRDFIFAYGTEAYKKTVQKLLDDEKARDNSDRNDNK